MIEGIMIIFFIIRLQMNINILVIQNFLKQLSIAMQWHSLKVIVREIELIIVIPDRDPFKNG